MSKELSADVWAQLRARVQSTPWDMQEAIMTAIQGSGLSTEFAVYLSGGRPQVFKLGDQYFTHLEANNPACLQRCVLLPLLRKIRAMTGVAKVRVSHEDSTILCDYDEAQRDWHIPSVNQN